MKILVVEDDRTVAQTLQLLFASYNYAVDIAVDGEAGWQMAELFEYDAILLDWMLPKLDGVNLCQQLRARGFRNPILLLTGQDEAGQKAIALNTGADDYVVKPFDAEELIARVQALLRRGGPTSQPVLSWGNLSFDPSLRSAAYGSQLLSLSPKQYAILELLQWQGEVQNISKTGQQVTVAARWTLIRDAMNQPQAILTVDTDITEKKLLEAKFYHNQRLESLGILASGIAHDLNNVLTPILGIAQLLRIKHSALDGSSREMLQVLEDSAKRGASMIRQILTFVRGTGGESSPIQVPPPLQDVLRIIQRSFPKSIEIRAAIPDALPWLVSADPTYLHQVVMNLCVNARDAMPDGGILSLSVEPCLVDEALAQTEPNARVGHYVAITVADTGTGILPEVRDRIFDPFFTTKPQGQGTGLGLATVLGIVKSYNGFIALQSQPGAGSQFTVYLPAIEVATPPSEVPAVLPQGRGELILIVDDDPFVLQSAQATLKAHHYRVLAASSGTEAIACYAEQPDRISAVIVDMMMPDMEGLATLQALQAIDPQIRAIATSGLTENYRQRLQALGISTLLNKPFATEELLQGIHRLIHAQKEPPQVV